MNTILLNSKCLLLEGEAMNAKEKAIIVSKLKEAWADCERYKGTELEHQALEVYYALRGLAIEFGIES